MAGNTGTDFSSRWSKHILYSLFCETQVCVFSTRQKCKVHAHVMHFHSMDRYPVKKRQNVQGFPTCILDRLHPLQKMFDMHFRHDLVKCKPAACVGFKLPHRTHVWFTRYITFWPSAGRPQCSFHPNHTPHTVWVPSLHTNTSAETFLSVGQAEDICTSENSSSFWAW